MALKWARGITLMDIDYHNNTKSHRRLPLCHRYMRPKDRKLAISALMLCLPKIKSVLREFDNRL